MTLFNANKLKLKSHMWLVATVLDSTALDILHDDKFDSHGSPGAGTVIIRIVLMLR